MRKSRLPDVDLAGGSYLDIYCKNSLMLFSYTTNFNLKAGETLILSDSKGRILDKIGVTEMKKNESFGRYRNTEDFVYFSTPSPGEANK